MIDETALKKARADDRFGENVWLTVYFDGEPAAHRAIKPQLERLAATNLCGGEYGFVFAKLPTKLEKSAIIELVAQVLALVSENGVSTSIIDLDSSDDVEKSKFYTIWQAPSCQ